MQLDDIRGDLGASVVHDASRLAILLHLIGGQHRLSASVLDALAVAGETAVGDVRQHYLGLYSAIERLALAEPIDGAVQRR